MPTTHFFPRIAKICILQRWLDARIVAPRVESPPRTPTPASSPVPDISPAFPGTSPIQNLTFSDRQPISFAASHIVRGSPGSQQHIYIMAPPPPPHPAPKPPKRPEQAAGGPPEGGASDHGADDLAEPMETDSGPLLAEPMEMDPGPPPPAEPMETDSGPSPPAEPTETDPGSLPTEPMQTDPRPSLPAEPMETDPGPSLPAGPTEVERRMSLPIEFLALGEAFKNLGVKRTQQLVSIHSFIHSNTIQVF